MKGARLNRRRQYRGTASVLLALVITGMISYWALRTTVQPVSAEGRQAHCEERIARLLADRGDVGAEAAAAYEELPAECRGLLRDRAGRTPPPQVHALSL